jgi:hypothetical protein
VRASRRQHRQATTVTAAAPAGPLLDFTAGGTFSRASAATSMIGVLGETRVDYSSGDRRVLTISGADYIWIEHSTTNLMQYSEAWGTSPWSSPGNSPVADQATAPDGTATADEQNLTGTTSDAGLRSAKYLMTGLTQDRHVNSTWVKYKTTSESVQLMNGNGGSDTFMTPEDWTRVFILSNNVTSMDLRYDNRVSPASGPGTSADLYGWGWVTEPGCASPDSRAPTTYIATTSATVTRASDQLTFTNVSVPATIWTGAWVFKWIPNHASSAVASGEHVLFANGTSKVCWAFGDLLQVWCGGVKELELASVTFAALATLTITVDLATSSLILSGAATGDGTDTGTAARDFDDSGTLYVGCEDSTTSFCQGRISEPEAV